MFRRLAVRLIRAFLRVSAFFILGSLGLFLLFRDSDLPALPVSPQEPEVLRHVTLIVPAVRPGTGGERRAGVTIRIDGGRITKIEDEKEGTRAGAAQAYVLPGLIDAHVHSPLLPGDHRVFATLYLLHGVTAVRNLGDGNQSLKRKPEVAAGRQAGPRIFSCGIHVDGEGGGFLARILKTPAEARAFVAAQKRAGADCIKVLSHLRADVLEALRDAARVAGLPIVGHMPNAYGGEGLLKAGLADVQHLTGVPTAPAPGLDDAEWRRFHQGFETLTPERIAWAVETSRRLGIIHTPTLIGSAYEARRQDGTVPFGLTPHLELLPDYYGQMWTRMDRARKPEARALAERNLPRYIEIVRALHQGGVTVQAGSDAFLMVPFVVPGAGLHEELSLLTRAGLSPEEALAAATVVPAAALGLPPPLTVGAPADLLLFREDPTASLDHLNSLESVIVDGRRYEKAELARQLEIELRATKQFPYSWAARILGWLLSAIT